MARVAMEMASGKGGANQQRGCRGAALCPCARQRLPDGRRFLPHRPATPPRQRGETCNMSGFHDIILPDDNGDIAQCVLKGSVHGYMLKILLT